MTKDLSYAYLHSVGETDVLVQPTAVDKGVTVSKVKDGHGLGLKARDNLLLPLTRGAHVEQGAWKYYNHITGMLVSGLQRKMAQWQNCIPQDE